MEKTKCVVFYSWQSDLHNNTNRGFIQDALEKAAKAIRNDDSIKIEPVIDRDTSGVPGSPDIARTIYNKINDAQIFVCDISIINQQAISQCGARPVPNPNVLIELGYALRALGENRIIIVLNDVYGDVKSLPFDLYTRRAITYHMAKETAYRAPERNRLAAIFTDALRTIINELDKPLLGEPIVPLSLAEQAQDAIKAQNPEQTQLVQQYMNELASNIEAMNPKYDIRNEEACAEQLHKAINDTTELVVEFSRLAKSITIRNADQSLKAMYRSFENILNLYTFPPDYQGQREVYVPDLARFVGHELFVTLFSYLLQEEKWERITEILEEDLFARSTSGGQPHLVPFHLLSETVRLLNRNSANRLLIKPTSLHTNLLVERHSQGELAKLVPTEQFAEADYFLFLRAQIQPAIAAKFPSWMPWSSLYIHQVPRFLQTAKYIKYAERLLKPLGVEDIPTLRTRLIERTGSLEEGWGYKPTRPWDNIIAGFDFSTIGTIGNH